MSLVWHDSRRMVLVEEWMNSLDLEIRIAHYIRKHGGVALSMSAHKVLDRDTGHLLLRHDKHVLVCVPVLAYHQYFGIPHELWEMHGARDIVVHVTNVVSRLRAVKERGFRVGVKVTYRIPNYTSNPDILSILPQGMLSLSDGRVAHPLWIWCIL